jgi:hypothetical protein
MPAPVLNEARPGDSAQWAAEAEERGCYCGLWVKEPDFYPSRGIAGGYCGKCVRCRAWGHSRHFPGPVPYTGTWCDRCYRIVGWRYFFLSPAGLVRLAIIGVVVYWVARSIT